jgi:hypothetical protein
MDLNGWMPAINAGWVILIGVKVAKFGRMVAKRLAIQVIWMLNIHSVDTLCQMADMAFLLKPVMGALTIVILKSVHGKIAREHVMHALCVPVYAETRTQVHVTSRREL